MEERCSNVPLARYRRRLADATFFYRIIKLWSEESAFNIVPASDVSRSFTSASDIMVEEKRSYLIPAMRTSPFIADLGVAS